MLELTIQTCLSVANGGPKIPILGLGVYKTAPSEVANSIQAALEAGYRHFDTAQLYQNECDVGKALVASGILREEIFITTKIMGPASSFSDTYAALKGSIEGIGLGYVDLFLIHRPGNGPESRRLLWGALEKLVEEGLTKAIGVSNFGVNHINDLKKFAKLYPPAVNQLELHPWFQQRDIVNFCKSEGIIVSAYCPLVRNQKAGHPLLMSLSKKYNKTTSQILIRYSLQKGWVPLPKSREPVRIAANAKVFDFALGMEDMIALDQLDQGPEGHITWTPQFHDL